MRTRSRCLADPTPIFITNYQIPRGRFKSNEPTGVRAVTSVCCGVVETLALAGLGCEAGLLAPEVVADDADDAEAGVFAPGAGVLLEDWSVVSPSTAAWACGLAVVGWTSGLGVVLAGVGVARESTYEPPPSISNATAAVAINTKRGSDVRTTLGMFRKNGPGTRLRLDISLLVPPILPRTGYAYMSRLRRGSPIIPSLNRMEYSFSPASIGNTSRLSE